MKNRYTLLLFFLFSIVADSVAQQPEKGYYQRNGI